MTEQLEKTSMPASRLETYRRYDHSPKGYARKKRYEDSEKGKARYDKHRAKYGGHAAYERERCRRIQDEAGCHMRVRDFYPAYCLIRAFATAEVVEI